jgi:hypothetical protein
MEFADRLRNRVINGRMLNILQVDHRCPTIRDQWYWSYIGPLDLWHELYRWHDKVLVTDTDPTYIIVVYSTYPKWCFHCYRIPRDTFFEFLDLCIQTSVKIAPLDFSWRKEGF